MGTQDYSAACRPFHMMCVLKRDAARVVIIIRSSCVAARGADMLGGGDCSQVVQKCWSAFNAQPTHV